ncbi:unnamed protein product [Ectocarpus sp. 12 AP-2014]
MRRFDSTASSQITRRGRQGARGRGARGRVSGGYTQRMPPTFCDLRKRIRTVLHADESMTKSQKTIGEKKYADSGGGVTSWMRGRQKNNTNSGVWAVGCLSEGP